MELLLYYRKTCPFCKKVLKMLEEESLSLPKKDLGEDPAYIEELKEIGGKSQVPCLIQIEEGGKKTALYESDDIIDFLRKQQ